MSVVVSIYSFTFDISSWKGITIMCIFCCLICSHIYWIIHQQHNERTCLLNAFMVVCTFWHALSDILFISICMYILRWNIWVYLCEDRLITWFIIALYYMSSKNLIGTHISSFNSKSNLLYLSLSRIMHWILNLLAMYVGI